MKRFTEKGRALVAFVLVAATLYGGAAPALAASDGETAAEKLAALGVLEGDETGNLKLDETLTRAQLAALLARLYASADSENDGLAAPGGAKRTESAFSDLPGWAVPYVEYCYAKSLLQGVSETRFDPDGKVAPDLLCAAVLLWLKPSFADWSRDTAPETARAYGLTNGADTDGESVTRGDAAVIIANAAARAPLTEDDEPKAEIVRLVNEKRERAGLAPLEVLPALADCAQVKARDIVDGDYYAHVSPTYGTPHEMIRTFVPENVTSGENLVFGDAPSDAFAAWMGSPAHRAVMLSSFLTHTGVGTAVNEKGNRIWVQQFVMLRR